MTIIRINHLTLPGKCNCNCPNRSENALRVRLLDQYRQDTVLFQTAILPLSSIGSRANFNKARAILKKVDGVKGVCLFFQKSALRLYYNPKRVSLYMINDAMRVLRNDNCDLQDH